MATLPDCAPLPPPTAGYICVDEEGNPIAVPPILGPDGQPLYQGPLRYCGTDEIICPDDHVSGCISDTDGAPTSYGPDPVGEPPLLLGRSPRISRVRVNRVGFDPLPYDGPNHPDQLIDIVDGLGDPIDYDPLEGRFQLPINPDFPTIPEAGCGLTDTAGVWSVEDDYKLVSDGAQELGNVVPFDSTAGMVFRLDSDSTITNTSCRPQHVHFATFAGFGITPVTPVAQVQYGIYDATAATVLQISQTEHFDVGWQRKNTYLYPAPNTTLAVAAAEGHLYHLFVQVLTGTVVWVDADFSTAHWYGK